MICRSLMGALALAAVAAASPAAAADFTGPRVGVALGIAGNGILDSDATTYGVNVGYDIAVGKAILGAQVEYQDAFEKQNPRDLSVTARVGTRVGTNGLIYATGGYTNLRYKGLTADGYRLGVGGEYAITSNVSATVEQRYSNYGKGFDGFQTVAGVNVRF